MATEQQQAGIKIYWNLPGELQHQIIGYLSDWYFENDQYDRLVRQRRPVPQPQPYEPAYSSVELLRYQNPAEWTFPSIAEVESQADDTRTGRYYNYHFDTLIPLPDLANSFPYFYYKYDIYLNEFADTSTINDEADYEDYDPDFYNWEA